MTTNQGITLNVDRPKADRLEPDGRRRFSKAALVKVWLTG
jgi:hypothetical protein